MKLHFGPLLLASMMVLVSLSGCLFEEEETSSNNDLLAVFNYSPSDNIRVGDTISFDASSSTPNDGRLTYRWDFDNDSSVDKTGMTAEWSYDSPGTKTIVLTISDGSITSEQIRELTIAVATAVEPIAEITQYADTEDCEDNDIDEERYIVLWMCHYDKSQTDRDVSETTTVSLDASNSAAGNVDEYISEYNWDIDLNIDADNDGDFENDADYSGETVTWADVEPGEYKIKLNIKNSQDMVDSDTIKVYVSYAAKWSDFEIGSNTSNNNELDFDVSITYDRDSENHKNTISKAVAELTYPQQDDGCINTLANNCRAKLDVYAYNEDDDEARNTSSVGLDQRNDGDDCDEANDCVFLTISSYTFGDSDNEGTYGDGDWTFKIENRERANDLRVESFIIRLVYV
jgi:PKD repeat protein